LIWVSHSRIALFRIACALFITSSSWNNLSDHGCNKLSHKKYDSIWLSEVTNVLPHSVSRRALFGRKVWELNCFVTVGLSWICA